MKEIIYVFICGCEIPKSKMNVKNGVRIRCPKHNQQLEGTLLWCPECKSRHKASKYAKKAVKLCPEHYRLLQNKRDMARYYATKNGTHTVTPRGSYRKKNKKSDDAIADYMPQKISEVLMDRSDCFYHDYCLDKLCKTSARSLKCEGCIRYDPRPLDSTAYIRASDSFTPTRFWGDRR